jgi:hypothetical protein
LLALKVVDPAVMALRPPLPSKPFQQHRYSFTSVDKDHLETVLLVVTTVVVLQAQVTTMKVLVEELQILEPAQRWQIELL